MDTLSLLRSCASTLPTKRCPGWARRASASGIAASAAAASAMAEKSVVRFMVTPLVDGDPRGPPPAVPASPAKSTG
jgi:hypothetical protein